MIPALLLRNLNDGLDLDWDIQRERVHADGGARVLAFLPKDLPQQLGCAVGDLGLHCGAIYAVDEGCQLDDALDLIEVANLGWMGREVARWWK